MASRRWLAAAILVGALARIPGIAWGFNWPEGFGLHHPDEYTHVQTTNDIITPSGPQTSVPYPKAMAAHAALPFLLWYAAHGSFGGPRIHLPWTVASGRLVSLAFGLAGILVVYLIGRDALRDERAGVLAAWLLALGGLHVTQSHFFLADIPATTWTMTALWLLWRDVSAPERGTPDALRWSAFAVGAAFALKLFVFAVPALLFVVFSRAPRGHRIVHAGVFAVAGFFVSSLGYESPATLYRAAVMGTGVPIEYSKLRGMLIYLVELPSILSLPLLLLAAAGTWSLVSKVGQAGGRQARNAVAVFASPPLVALLFVAFKLDNFPRHLIFFIPFAALAGGWCLSRTIDVLRRRRRSAIGLLAVVFGWMAIFVADGERFFIFEPRNGALRWLRAHVAEGSTMFWMGRRTPTGYRAVSWPSAADSPEYLVVEMFEANLSLSGVDWRNSYPSDPRRVYDGRTAERVAAIQSLFRGTSDYEVAARFPDAYVMPEYRLSARLLGDRSRSYISEVIVFRRGQ